MLARRGLLFALAALPVPAAALAQPWWNQRREDALWARERERQRRYAEAHHRHWDERRARAAWRRHQRFLAQRDWERRHRGQP